MAHARTSRSFLQIMKNLSANEWIYALSRWCRQNNHFYDDAGYATMRVRYRLMIFSRARWRLAEKI